MPLHSSYISKKALFCLSACLVSSLTLGAVPFVAQAQTQVQNSEPDTIIPAINDQATSTPLREQAAKAIENAVGKVSSRKSNLMDMPVSALPSIADLVERVSPSVVNIVVTTETGETTSEGQGSGFVISNKNEVVTNYHVIDGGTNIEIEFNDGRRYPARILGTDEETDLALLQIKTLEVIPHVSFQAQNDLRIGDWVVAIGNPFGIGQSTSLGVISAIGRERVESGSYVDYIQTDATINRGNSGGPLFNLDGEVVGVNSAIYSPTGASVGIAFVIPHHTAEDVVSSLRAYGRVRRGFLGAGLRDAEYSLEGESTAFKVGALVNAIVPNSPAARYGLQVDDIILQVNDEKVANSVDATRLIGKLRPGDVARLVYEREEEPYAINVSIGERPDKHGVDTARATSQGLPPPPPKEPARPPINIDTGLQVLDISSEFRSAIKMRSDQVGIYVESVTPGSEAARGGFKSGMVLLEADGTPLAETDVLRTVVLNAKLKEKSSIQIKVRLQNGRETQMRLPL
ncbi:serine protease Do [Litorimonas taeanensis]|uniref:Serine protease Do n=1 Tax=Litorimonas taeanensis TaxID=568099 RepID=A0A420WIR5_9PROT|nr:trypsin-like peptidase domain-containing protein [Litorimonas taeanensis]RKQ70921.1 serine protease Do [Litorimonas taeanensis]